MYQYVTCWLCRGVEAALFVCKWDVLMLTDINRSCIFGNTSPGYIWMCCNKTSVCSLSHSFSVFYVLYKTVTTKMFYLCANEFWCNNFLGAVTNNILLKAVLLQKNADKMIGEKLASSKWLTGFLPLCLLLSPSVLSIL